MNHPESTGVSPRARNTIDGIRMSMAINYLDTARHRLNFTIRSNVTVRRIIFEGKRAVGVEAESGGDAFTSVAELIVVSSGAVAAPQLLMLSGIGPAEHLKSFGITNRAQRFESIPVSHNETASLFQEPGIVHLSSTSIGTLIEQGPWPLESYSSPSKIWWIAAQ